MSSLEIILSERGPRLLALALAVASVAVGTTAAAQKTQKRTSTIIGVATDSLHHRPLSGADVMITGVTRALISDSLGRFRVDSLPAGTYQVGIFHPLLDSLAISLSSPSFSLGADSVSLIRLAVPSAATLVAQKCTPRMRTLGNSAIFGRLIDPDTEEPVPHAEVSIVWVQYDMSTAFGVKPTPRLVRDSTDSDGVFRLCGLPSELDARLQANFHGVTTADVPVSTSSADADFVIRPLYVSKADTAAGHAGRALVTGRVTYAGGQPATGSRVEIVGTKRVVIVDERGEFTLGGAPSGTQMLLVRRLGWEPREIPVNLSASRPQRVAVQLKKYVPVMDPVVVTARSEKTLERLGFTSRKKSGMGHYLTAAEIEHRNPTRLSDVLRTVPGLTVQQQGSDLVIVSTRGGPSSQGCINYFVDGMPFQSLGGSADDFVNPREVAGIEVYQPSVVPGEFMSNNGQSCTTIVIWTKQRVRY